MNQSQARVPGRHAGGPPPSFGRDQAGPEVAEEFTVRGGEALHLVLHVSATPDARSLEALRAAVREATRAGVLDGVLDGYAAALQEMDAGGPEEQPGGGHGGAPPGETG